MTNYDTQRNAIIKMVQAITGWPVMKAAVWFAEDNPLLGGVSPRHMVLQGRYENLLKFIEEQRDE